MAAPLTLPDNVSVDFFKIGEIRRPTDKDFQHFMSLNDENDGWILKCDKNEVKVWMKDIPGVTVKMLKVRIQYSANHDTSGGDKILA